MVKSCFMGIVDDWDILGLRHSKHLHVDFFGFKMFLSWVDPFRNHAKQLDQDGDMSYYATQPSFPQLYAAAQVSVVIILGSHVHGKIGKPSNSIQRQLLDIFLAASRSLFGSLIANKNPVLDAIYINLTNEPKFH